MKKKYLILIFVILIFNFADNILFAELYQNIEKLLIEKSGYTLEQIKNIKEILEKAKDKKLPEKILQERIQEAIAKKVSYEIFKKVFSDKIDKLFIAKKLVKNANSSPEYNIKVLAELLERGLTEEEFNEISAISSLTNKKFQHIIVYIQVYIMLKEEGLTAPLAKEIIIQSMKLKLIEVKKIPDIFKEAKKRNISFKKVRDIFVEGTDKKKGYLLISRKILGIQPEEIIEEIQEEIKREYEQRKR